MNVCLHIETLYVGVAIADRNLQQWRRKMRTLSFSVSLSVLVREWERERVWIDLIWVDNQLTIEIDRLRIRALLPDFGSWTGYLRKSWTAFQQKFSGWLTIGQLSRSDPNPGNRKWINPVPWWLCWGLFSPIVVVRDRLSIESSTFDYEHGIEIMASLWLINMMSMMCILLYWSKQGWTRCQVVVQ